MGFTDENDWKLIFIINSLNFAYKVMKFQRNKNIIVPLLSCVLICVSAGMMASHYHGLSQHIAFEQLAEPGERFQLEQVIGEGTYGEVFCAKDRDAGHRVAIKVLENVADNVEEIEEEFLVLRDLSLHPNIPLFYGLFLKRGPTPDDDQLWFAMEVSTRCASYPLPTLRQ